MGSNFKNSLLKENLENKVKISACGGDNNATTGTDGKCVCLNGYGQLDGVGYCILCGSIDKNSQASVNGGCECKPNFVFDKDGSRKCVKCDTLDTGSITDNKGGCICRGNRVLDPISNKCKTCS